MRTDTERLEWFTQNVPKYISSTPDGDSCRIVWPYGYDERSEKSWQILSYNSVREAIDAAMDKKDDGR